FSLSPACMLCHRIQADTDICGDKRVRFKLCVHTYCQVTSPGLPPAFCPERPGLSEHNMLPVLSALRLLCSFQSCFICYKMGATITCCQTGCDRTFHLPCAPDGQCVTQYFGAYRSFCWEHSPQQKLQPRPSQDNTCTICLDTVEDIISYKTMGCPACQDARFHRQCIQRLALHAGIGFGCPCCLNQEPFMIEMLTMGIRLPKRLGFLLPAHKASDQRHSRCDAAMCLCPGSREHAEADGPWQLWLCSSCAAQGTHRQCSSLGNSIDSWECNTCAGVDTGRHQSIQCQGMGTGQAGPDTLSPVPAGLSRHPAPWPCPSGLAGPTDHRGT
uniref:RING-type domain-containing protein n=1 Tax=Cyanoderma ruficeps TaxID=181631 RepID=A0A8C3RF96_9PASS